MSIAFLSRAACTAPATDFGSLGVFAVFRATGVLTALFVFVIAMQTVFRSVEVIRGDVPRY